MSLQQTGELIMTVHLCSQKEEASRTELFGSSSALRSPTLAPRESPFSANLHRTNASIAASNGPSYGGAGLGLNGSMRGDYRTNAALNEHSFLSSTSNTLDAYIAQGQAILGNLGDQRDILKGARALLAEWHID